MIEIDGSFGEGGGQILRTALSLSCLFTKPFRMFNIRKGRKRSGLMPQHLTCIRAAQLISGAEVIGNQTGSSELIFKPKIVRGGEFLFDIGTAGSTSLVLQTIIPALIFSREKTTAILKGGTHVPFSPPYDYITGVFAAILERVGIRIQLTIESYGFYPKGGGKIKAEIFPASDIKPLKITVRGKIMRIKGYSGVGNLPLSIAERQRNAFTEKVNSEIKDLNCPVEIEPISVSTIGNGTFLYIQSESENSIAGFISLGERGKRAETVGRDAATEFIKYFSSNAAFDPHLSDQIVLYLAMSKESSMFTTSCVTQHLITNLWAIKFFHEFDYSVDKVIGKHGTVKIM